MDALKFLTEQKRFCRSQDCSTCPAYIYKGDCYLMYMEDGGDDFFDEDFFRKSIEIVEKWSEANPNKTNGDVIRELYGAHIVYENEDDNFVIFDHDWWNAEYKRD